MHISDIDLKKQNPISNPIQEFKSQQVIFINFKLQRINKERTIVELIFSRGLYIRMQQVQSRIHD